MHLFSSSTHASRNYLSSSGSIPRFFGRMPRQKKIASMPVFV
ncbi:hypothetical protein SZ54_2296 [Rhizobium sp. UR51a]|nr:hypothetical protein SZ54_2296 [Rhizobium sp. UR51a]